MWTRHVECTDIVKEGWDMHSKSDLKDLVTEVKNCGKLLSKWNREVFGNLNSIIGQKQKELDELMSSSSLEAQAIETCKKDI